MSAEAERPGVPGGLHGGVQGGARSGTNSGPQNGLQYERLYLPPGTSRRTAQTVLTLHAEYGEWELDRLRLYPDGSRRVVLRRKARPGLLPFLPS